MSRTTRILLVGIIAIIAGGGYWKVMLAPKRAQAAELTERVAVAQSQLAQQQNLIATYKGAKEDYKANYTTVVRLGKAVPTDDDTRSLLVQLDTSAKRSGVDFNTINVTGGGQAADTATGGAPVAPGAINAGAFSAMPFSFGFTGSFDSLGNFFSRLERFVSLKGDTIEVSGRLMRIENITLAPGDQGWPQLTAQIGASAYIVPETSTVSDTGATAAASTATSATTTTTTTQGSSTGTNDR